MLPTVKINSYQFLVLVILFTIGTSILVIPSALAANAKQDAWIAAILGMGIGLLIVWLFTKIGLWFPNLTYIQVNETLFGKWIGNIFSFLFIFMTFLYTAILLYYSGSFLTIHVMPNTPMAATNILLAIILVMAVRLGLETVARSAEIFIVIFFILFFILVVFIAPEVEFKNIQPVLETDINKIFQSSLPLIVLSAMNAISLLMIFPAFINRPRSAKKYFLIGNIIGGLIITIITTLCILVLGSDMTAFQKFPGYELAKKINIGNFVTRIEAMMAALWIICLYFKMVIYFYAAVIGLAQMFQLKDYRPLTYPLGMIVVILSLVIFPNILEQSVYDATIDIYFALTVCLLLPLLMVVVYAIRKKQLKKNSDHA
ncbi:GerAB/ArcD/ProY family transporter [Psychrobacillus soli]|uniref:Spore gernimation protein n=1 Tax=Psychrobacillus soli TaxID=1543965 RepID=A0A544TM62_9BACI|nr:endospore germination permease [Psychrobacillus soli]TQR18490.1 spore gernimation protein [Psychrobacillus soli]